MSFKLTIAVTASVAALALAACSQEEAKPADAAPAMSTPAPAPAMTTPPADATTPAPTDPAATPAPAAPAEAPKPN